MLVADLLLQNNQIDKDILIFELSRIHLIDVAPLLP